MPEMLYNNDVNPELLSGKRVAVIGFGSQGHAHSLNMFDSGIDVTVGLREGSRNWEKAKEQGVKVDTPANAAKWANVIMMLVPDTLQAQIYKADIEPNLEAGDTLMFAHGFNIHYGEIVPPTNVDVSMVAPKAPGHRVREVYMAGGGVPGLVAVHQDASGSAMALAQSYSYHVGCTRAGILLTTFKDETETDLFGEQAVLCGGVSALVKAGFETLTEAGYMPELAYFECMHELKLIVDLFYRGGLNYMRYSVSDTAEQGDYHAGPRVINEESKESMRTLLKEIQDGTFARMWIDENKNGRPNFNAVRRSEQDHPIEQVGAQLRGMMPFIDPVEIKPGQ